MGNLKETSFVTASTFLVDRSQTKLVTESKLNIVHLSSLDSSFFKKKCACFTINAKEHACHEDNIFRTCSRSMGAFGSCFPPLLSKNKALERRPTLHSRERRNTGFGLSLPLSIDREKKEAAREAGKTPKEGITFPPALCFFTQTL